MDINELPTEQFNRHPWELSRRDSFLRELRPLLRHVDGDAAFIDLGAGDQFFDDALLARHGGYRVAAVDIGYTPSVCALFEKQVRCRSRIQKAVSLDEVAVRKAGFALMLDSLEYMEDEAACLRAVAARVGPGGFVMLAMPAFPMLYSKHDVTANNLRRYRKKDFRRILRDVPGLTPVRMHYYYTSLFFVRLAQKLFPGTIDTKGSGISGWRYPERHILTKTATAVLNADYAVNRFLGRAGLDLPGLSLLAICRKDDGPGGTETPP